MFGKMNTTIKLVLVSSEGRSMSTWNRAIIASFVPIALVGCVTALPMAPESLLLSGSPAAWEGCRSQVYDGLLAQGEREAMPVDTSAPVGVGHVMISW